MPWIQIVPPEAATGQLRTTYETIVGEVGHVPNILQAFSLKPDSLLALVKLRKTLAAGGSSLGRRKEELINTAVSKMNQCNHCTRAHGAVLRRMYGKVADQVTTDWHTAELAPDEQVMLEFCEKVTLFRSTLERSDTERLRASGFSDYQILEVVLITAYRHFMNIVADTLGVEDEPT